MVTAAQQKAADDKADDKKVDDDYVTPTAVSQPPVPEHATVEGPDGISRIVNVGVTDGWEPAPVKVTDEQQKAADERVKAEEERAEALKEGRIDPVSGKPLSKSEWAAHEKERKAAEKDQA